MCNCSRTSIRNADPKTRRLWSCGQICLVTGTSLTLFAAHFAQRHHNLFNALRGFFLGMALVFLFWSIRRMRRTDSCA